MAMWTLALRFWPHLLALGAIIGLGWYIHHSGYEAGYAASESQWKPRFEAADRARTAANARATALETASKALSEQYEARHAETLQTLTVRAANSQRRIDGLVRELAARPGRCPMPEAGRSTPLPDEPSTGDQFLASAGVDLTEIARRCESDAAQLAALQAWIRDQFALLEVPQ